MDFGNVDLNQWPIWVVLALMFVASFRKELAVFVPKSIHNHFVALSKQRAIDRSHIQELEEVSVNATLQHNAAAQMQLINVNEKLMEFVTNQMDTQLSDIKSELEQVQQILHRLEGNGRIVQAEWQRILATMEHSSRILSQVETWLRYADHSVEGIDG